MKLLFVLITFLCINLDFVLSESRLKIAQRKLQNDPSQSVLTEYPELKDVSREIQNDCYNPYYSSKNLNPLERPVGDIVSDFLVSKLFQCF